MATTTSTSAVILPGQSNLAGDAHALNLKVFTGEVMTAHEIACVTKGRFREQRISNGKVAQFLVTGRLDQAVFHQRGQNILEDQTAASGGDVKLLGQVASAEKVIGIDRPLGRGIFLDKHDQSLMQADLRGEYARTLGETIALQYDQWSFALILQAALQANGIVTSLPGGNVVYGTADFGHFGNGDVDETIAAIKNMRLAFRNANVKETPVMFCTWDLYYFLVNECRAVVLDTDINPGGNGSIANGTMGRIFGFELVPTTNMPTSATFNPLVPGNTGISSSNDYGDGNGSTADFSEVGALFAHRSSLGVVTVDGAPEIDVRYWETKERLGNVLDAWKTCGMGWLAPETTGVIYAAAAP